MYTIDSILPNCKSWDEFISELKSLGCEVKTDTHISIKLPEAIRRFSSLPAGYDENSIRARLASELVFKPKPLRETEAKAPQLFINIQQKMQEGYGKGFENWAAVENLKRSANTLIYIRDSGIASYDELCEKCSAASGEVLALSNRIRDIEVKQKSINELQKYIGTYGKTRAVYAEYMSIKDPKKQNEFYENHRANIMLHQAAKKYFNDRGLKRLPSIKMLRDEWTELKRERHSPCADYKKSN